MHDRNTRRTLLLTAGLLALAVAGCSSSTAPKTTPNFAGTYTLTGAYTLGVSGTPNTGVFGSMQITNQHGTSATDSVVFVVEFGGNIAVMLDSVPTDTAAVNPVRCGGANAGCVYAYGPVAPAQVTLGTDGSFTALFTGKELSWNQNPATCCTDSLTLTGKLSTSNTITGTWLLTISAPINGRDGGTFVAQR